MKDSGVEWIGEIPAPVKLLKAKYLFSFQKGKLPSSVNNDGQGLPCIGASEMNGAAPTVFTSDDLPTCKETDVLLLWDGANAGLVSSGHSGIVSSTVCRVRLISDSCTPRFAYYSLKNAERYYREKVGGTTIPHMNSAYIDDTFIIAFDLSEQQRIANYLDSKCASIDGVIAKTTESIEEYKKLKQAVITEAVTKGVRGKRPMKSACSDWFTEIPNEWQVRKVLSFLDMRVIDGPHESPELHEQGIPYVSATAIENGKICFDKMRGFISPEYCDICDKRYVPKRNDILMIKLGASTGQVAIVDTDRRFNIWVPLAAIRCNASASYKYMYYCFQSTNLIRQMELSWTFGTQQTLGVKTIEQLKVTFPSLDEQREIADYLDSKCAAIDTLISKKQQFIDELTAYKKSLIYEYVTGKKEVPA